MGLFKKNSNVFHKFYEYVINARNPVVIPHENPDGDAIGSALAIYHLFQSLGVNVKVISPNDYPDFLKWMPGTDKVLIAQKHLKTAAKVISNADLIICVDFNDISRMSILAPLLQYNTSPVILLDHHPEPVKFFNHLIHTTEASSTSEIVFDTIEKSGFAKHIGFEMAQCLYAGIMTDTGSFNYNSSNANTFRVVSKLLKTGIDKDEIYDKVYNNFSAQRMRLLGYALNQKMTVMPEYETAYIELSLKDLTDYNYQVGDTEGFVNYPLSVQGVKVSAIFIERKDQIKISFRSKGLFAVNRFAAEHFSGGGHLNAAGGEYHGSLKDAVSKFLNIIENYKNEIK